MARALLIVCAITTRTQVGLGAATLLVCAIALVMCASHARRWRRVATACRSSYNPVIQLDTDARILTTKRFQSGGGEEAIAREREVWLWQKNVLMGEKCQLPDFSGVIVYDSAGNLIPKAATPAARSL